VLEHLIATLERDETLERGQIESCLGPRQEGAEPKD